MSVDWRPYPPPLSDKILDWQCLAEVGGESLVRDKHVLDVGPFWGVEMLMFGSVAKRYVVLDKFPSVLDHISRLRYVVPEVGVHAGDMCATGKMGAHEFDVVLDFSSADDSGNSRAAYLNMIEALVDGGTLVTSYANEDVLGVYTGASRPGELADWFRRHGVRVLRRFNEDKPRACMVLQKRDFSMVSLECTRKAWSRAADFPANKEEVYPGHAEAHGFDKLAGKTVLEYGCGGGSDAMSLLRRDCTVYYADVTPPNVARSTERIKEAGLSAKATPLVLDESDRIRLPDQTLDAVTSHGVIHHIEDPIPVMKEFNRLLKPGGRIYIMLYTRKLRERGDTIVSELCVKHDIYPHEAFCWFTDGPGTPYAIAYSEDDTRALFDAAGFELLEAHYYNNDDFCTYVGVKR